MVFKLEAEKNIRIKNEDIEYSGIPELGKAPRNNRPRKGAADYQSFASSRPQKGSTGFSPLNALSPVISRTISS